MLIMPDNTIFQPVKDPDMREERVKADRIPMEERLGSFDEIEKTYTREQADTEAKRCLQCPTHWCQKECPAGVPVTDFIGKVQQGDLEGAYQLIRTASTLPEICSRVCPQEKQCQSNCTRSIRTQAVGIGKLERYVTEQHYASGAPEKKAEPTGKKVAVVGSGPAGLSAAQVLISLGHDVTVLERDQRPGGLLEYGIPNMKLEKSVVARKIESLEKQGVKFQCGVNVGKTLLPEQLEGEYDAVLLAVGAKAPRILDFGLSDGEKVEGIVPAVEFLSAHADALEGKAIEPGSQYDAKGKDVIIVGGGDTGNDCLGTSLRDGASSITQIEMLPQNIGKSIQVSSRKQRPKETKTDTSQEEYASRYGKDPHVYQTTIKEVQVEDGKICGVTTIGLAPVYDGHFRLTMKEIPGSEKQLPCSLLVFAAGFLGPEGYVPEAFGSATDARGNIKASGYLSSSAKVFACGDCRTGQSLVVKAMADGRDCAKAVDEFLKG